MKRRRESEGCPELGRALRLLLEYPIPRVAPHGNAAPDDATANALWPRDFDMPDHDPDED